jgi:hypothetical protein
MPPAELCALHDLRIADPVHAKVTEILTAGIPGHKIPERRQDEHGLWFDFSDRFKAFGVTVTEPQMQPLQKCRFERGQ